MNTWFTADTHFNHRGIISTYSAWGMRKFNDINEMNECMVMNWNAVVRPGDIIYHLGDFGWKNCEGIVKRLNGQKFLIEGSHDAEGKRLKKHFCQITPMKQIRIDDQWIVMTHCAMRVWERSHYGSWNLHGHSHGALKEQWANQMDVGVDTNNYYPYSYEQVREFIENFKKGLDKVPGMVYNSDDRYSC